MRVVKCVCAWDALTLGLYSHRETTQRSRPIIIIIIIIAFISGSMAHSITHTHIIRIRRLVPGIAAGSKEASDGRKYCISAWRSAHSVIISITISVASNDYELVN